MSRPDIVDVPVSSSPLNGPRPGVLCGEVVPHPDGTARLRITDGVGMYAAYFYPDIDGATAALRRWDEGIDETPTRWTRKVDGTRLALADARHARFDVAR